MNNIYEILTTLLKTDERFVSLEGNLLRNTIYEAANNLDPKLLHLLLSNEATKKNFFQSVDDILIFDKTAFGWVINNKQFLPDSYTRFKNKIGLADSYGNMIASSGNVELVFPYKDCILEGGQSKEEEKRSEIFYNETLAPNEIDRLLYPKVLINAHKYIVNKKYKITSFSEEDNLIIKGNNLLGLSSLLKRYEGKIKCIYIDPPYNTRSDANTFSYNNTFNHSTWLSFMKTRLELAKRLLSDDGVIFIDIDHYELFYLGVLADQIFGYNNRLGILAVVHNLKGRYNEFFSIAHENKIVYAKNAENATIKEYKFDNSENYPYSDSISKYKTSNLQRTGNGSLRADRPNLFYPIYYNPKTKVIEVDEQKINSNFVSIYPIDSKGIERRWRWGKSKVQKEWKTELIVKEIKGEYKLYTKIRIKGDRPKTLWNKPEYSSTTGTNELKQMVTNNVFSYPKSVELVIDSLSIATDEDSIVLDFFGGSGTTGQAVMDLNKRDNGSRKFILIEQMDYINMVTIPRLQATLEKNKTGHFIYCELAKLNQLIIDEIEVAKTTEQLLNIWNKIKGTGFISYKINPSTIDKNIKDFKELSIENKKRFLMEILDKNMLYVNLCDIDDEEFNISEDDKAFNKMFYGQV